MILNKFVILAILIIIFYIPYTYSYL